MTDQRTHYIDIHAMPPARARTHLQSVAAALRASDPHHKHTVVGVFDKDQIDKFAPIIEEFHDGKIGENDIIERMKAA